MQDMTGEFQTAVADSGLPTDWWAPTMTQLLAGEAVIAYVVVVTSDLCDEGHVHAEVTALAATPTRCLYASADDGAAVHVNPDDPNDRLDVPTRTLRCQQVALRAIREVAVTAAFPPDGSAEASAAAVDIAFGGPDAADVYPESDEMGSDEGFSVTFTDRALRVAADPDSSPRLVADVLKFGAALSLAAAAPR